ncbi:MAG TPA: DUF4350 domain-containing protein [Mucilaginibacter sp.]
MKDFKIYLSIASVLLIVFLVAQYNKPPEISWTPTLYYGDKIPYGTFITYHQLGDIFPGAKVVKTNSSIYKEFHDNSVKSGNYLIIAKSIKITRIDFAELKKFVQAGNSVFMASFSFGGYLADSLKIKTGYELKNPTLNFTNSELKQDKEYKFRNDAAGLYFENFDTTKAVVLGMNNFGHSTFLSFKMGKGNLFITCTPLAFTNYSLLNNNNADYAAKALSYMPAAKIIYWDEYQNGDIEEDDSPLRVFFEHPQLQWAYYIALFSLVIFVLYEIKRRQRIIPIVEPLANSTLGFVTTVGQVYYEKRDNTNITQKKITYFLSHLRDEYHIKTNKLDQEFIEILAAKTGITHEFATELVNKILQLEKQRITDNELVNLNRLIEKFYTRSK